METRKTKIIGIVALVTLALTVVTATYAYFQAQIGDPAAVDISVNAHTVDTFTFSVGKPISITLDQDTFASGTGNQVGSTIASARLTANNKTNSATEYYYMYLFIPENTYTYSIDENTPEIILTVTDASGNAVEISGLTSVTAIGANETVVSGYDITNKTGIITILNNREITANSEKEEKWNITITFINYDENQSNNAGKSMSAKVSIQKEKIIASASDCTSGQTLSSCIIATADYDSTLYHHDGTITSDAGTILDAQDNSYRYAGASAKVNNYVCFGYDGTDTCPTDYLYRIIGVFDNQVKLIKSTPATSTLFGTDGDYSSGVSYSWNHNSDTSINDGNGSNTWSTSLLNKINFNTNFIENIGEKYSKKIAETTWKVGGNTDTLIKQTIPTKVYEYEIKNSVIDSTSNSNVYGPAKIGLMYITDYTFAASPNAWTTQVVSYGNNNSVNWMFISANEWTITRDSYNLYFVFYVSANGSIYTGRASVAGVVRPVFYLTSDVTYASGDGTQSLPIRINLD